MKLKQIKYLIYTLAAACVLMVLLLAVTESMVFLWLMLAFAVAMIGVNLVWWRCPYCGEHLGRGTGKYCTHCGHHLVDLE